MGKLSGTVAYSSAGIAPEPVTAVSGTDEGFLTVTAIGTAPDSYRFMDIVAEGSNPEPLSRTEPPAVCDVGDTLIVGVKVVTVIVEEVTAKVPDGAPLIKSSARM
jgi:hypothetical protein